jgi:alkyl sulfatase BDS1-like metallo-beta-lactamase superfamily hydrolase
VPIALASPDLLSALTVEQLLDGVAIRLDGPRCWHESFAIDWVLTDDGHTYRTALSNGVLLHERDPRHGEAGLRVTLTRRQLVGLLAGVGLEDMATEGDATLLARLASYLDAPDPSFAIVTP